MKLSITYRGREVQNRTARVIFGTVLAIIWLVMMLIWLILMTLLAILLAPLHFGLRAAGRRGFSCYSSVRLTVKIIIGFRRARYRY